MKVEGEIVVVTAATIDPHTSRAINSLGQQSSRAQGLATAITFAAKLQSSGDRAYLFRQCSDQSFIGFLRVGQRKLFLYDAYTELHEMQPLCCLDFFVVQSSQRQGIGRQLFDRMLRHENGSSPAQLAFDKPSPNLLSFLSNNFGLENPIVQTNNFVIFLEFFQTSPGDSKAAKLLQQCQPHRKVKTHYDSSGMASLLSNHSAEPDLSSARRKYHLSNAENPVHVLSEKVSEVLRNTHSYKQEDLEALRLSEESLVQINKKIEERESTIARIEKELQSLEVANENLHFARPGKDGFSKSELIRTTHLRNPQN